MLEDKDFIEYLAFEDIQEEYIIKKKQLYQSIDQKYEKEKRDLIQKKMEGIQQDKNHRMILNACIFPFSQDGPMAESGYYFIRASPLAELGISNLDFLLFHPEPTTSAIFGEAKGKISDSQKIIDEFKKRIKAVYDSVPYISKTYFKNLDADLEFVMGVYMSYATEMLKSIERKGGKIKVWSTGPRLGSIIPELSLVRPLAEDNPTRKTMFHKDRTLNQKLSKIQTSFDYKSIFPDSHTFAKLSLLILIRDDDGSFAFNDLFEIVKEELHYMEEDVLKKETEHILIIAQEISFIEKVESKIDGYKIISRAKKADSREEELKRKWINFSIQKDNEREKDEGLTKLQDQFRTERNKRKTITDFSSS